MGSDMRRKIIKTVGYIPVLICFFLLGWSYYAYNILFCFFILPEVYDNVPLKIILAVISHLLLLLCVWSYIKVVFVHPGKPNKSRKVFEDVSGPDDSTYDASNPVIEPHQIQRVFQGHTEVTPAEPHRTSSVGQHLVTVKSNGEKRYCRKCDFEKPDRTHHCSICDECILKMDHHCPWINNCVGFHNQKYFLLFILYTTLYCIVVAVSLIPGFYTYTRTNHILTLNEFQLVFLCLVSVMFGIVLLCFTGYNFHLLLTNRSTIENMESTRYKGDHVDPATSKTINVFNVGYKRNFQEVMGRSPYLWFLPVPTTLGDGMLFPLSSRAYNLLSSRD